MCCTRSSLRRSKEEEEAIKLSRRDVQVGLRTVPGKMSQVEPGVRYLRHLGGQDEGETASEVVGDLSLEMVEG